MDDGLPGVWTRALSEVAVCASDEKHDFRSVCNQRRTGGGRLEEELSRDGAVTGRVALLSRNGVVHLLRLIEVLRQNM